MSAPNRRHREPRDETEYIEVQWRNDVKKYIAVAALLLASATGAYAAEPEAVSQMVADCCAEMLGCCDEPEDCCP